MKIVFWLTFGLLFVAAIIQGCTIAVLAHSNRALRAKQEACIASLSHALNRSFKHGRAPTGKEK